MHDLELFPSPRRASPAGFFHGRANADRPGGDRATRRENGRHLAVICLANAKTRDLVPVFQGEIPMASRGARAGGKPKGGKKGKPPMSGGKKGALPKADKGGY
jgi:hypothetical protein